MDICSEVELGFAESSNSSKTATVLDDKLEGENSLNSCDSTARPWEATHSKMVATTSEPQGYRSQVLWGRCPHQVLAPTQLERDCLQEPADTIVPPVSLLLRRTSSRRHSPRVSACGVAKLVSTALSRFVAVLMVVIGAIFVACDKLTM